MPNFKDFLMGATDPFNPTNEPDLEVSTRYPDWVQDSGGVDWILDMTWYQVDMNNKDTRVLAVRYTSQEKTQFVVEQHIIAKDFPKLDDYQYIKKRLEELQQMIEEKAAIRKAPRSMGVAGKKKVGNA